MGFSFSSLGKEESSAVISSPCLTIGQQVQGRQDTCPLSLQLSKELVLGVLSATGPDLKDHILEF